MRSKLIVGAVVLVVVFLLGYVPQRREVGRSQQQIQELQRRVAEREKALQQAELRDLAALMHIEAARRNYQRAAEHSTRFFNRLTDAVKASEEAELREAFRGLLEMRDTVTAKLAQGDPGVTGDIQDLLLRLHEVTAAR